MDQELKIKWIQALRSGKYRQARNIICEVKNKRYVYCCLGVLARVAGASFPKSQKFPDCPVRVPVINGQVVAEEGLLSEDFGNKVGVPMSSQKILANMNDGEMASFGAIADWIEQNL